VKLHSECPDDLSLSVSRSIHEVSASASHDPQIAQKAAAFFDLDKTIIARSSTLAFTRPFGRAGLLGRRAVLRSAYAQLVYVMNGADHDQLERMRAYLSEMVAGWEVDQVRGIVAETLHDLIDPMVFAEAAELLEEHRAAGHDIVIVSTSGSEIVEPIGEMLGADHVIATRMVVEDGCFTGEIGYYAYGPTKADAIRELSETEGYDLAASAAYSDSFTDLPMLETVGHPYAVNPDRALRKVAVERDWPVLSFRRPVALRRRFPGADASPQRKAAAAAVLGAATGAVVWYVRRRARTSS
jgi:HAD superfamily hydrolase (TIGR01490 family)